MNSLLQNSIEINDISLQDIVHYLERHGWHLVRQSNERILEFLEPRTDEVDPDDLITVVLPSNENYRDYKLRLSETILTLADLKTQDPIQLIREIKRNNINTINAKMATSSLVSEESITMGIARKFIGSLYDLLSQTIDANNHSRQPIRPKYEKNARDRADEYRFAHTFKGSFGFTIEAPHIDEPAINVRNEDVNFSRIFKGFSDLRLATAKQKADLVTQNYSKGLNANMCEALKKMIAEIDTAITISWGDSDSNELITLSQEMIPILDQAISTFQQMEYSSEYTFRTKIQTLNPQVSSLGDNLIRIKVYYQPERRRIPLLIPLEREEYRKACDAHRDNRQIEITGTVAKYNRHWVMENPQEFEIV